MTRIPGTTFSDDTPSEKDQLKAENLKLRAGVDKIHRELRWCQATEERRKMNPYRIATLKWVLLQFGFKE
jgi:hypothetical protein